MFLRHLSFLAAGLLAAALACDRAAAGGVVRASGTGAAIALLQHLGARLAVEQRVEFVVIRSLGSAGAVKALADGKLDLAIVGRRLNSRETAAGLHEAMSLRTAYVLATSRPDPGNLASGDVARIFGATNPVWPDGSPVRIILRPRSDTDSELLGDLFPGMKQAIEAARQRPELPTVATDQDNADMAERLTGSLTGITATQIRTEGLMLHTLSIDGVEASFANFESGAYRYAKTLYVITGDTTNVDVAHAIDFLRSPAGLQFLRDAEVLPEAR
jgi:phosphate transport system substrate-binding protein